jgi:hypothetical protein
MGFKVLILGSSNGLVYGGYSAAIASHPMISEVRNISLGASPAVMAPYRLKDINLSNYDFLFIESTINDVGAISSNAYSVENLRSCLEWLVAEAGGNGVVPVAICIPAQSQCDGPDYPHALAAAHDCFGDLVFDMNPPIKNLAQRLSIPVSGLMQDPAHLHPIVSKLLAQKFLDWLLVFNRADLLGRTKKSSTHKYFYLGLSDGFESKMASGLYNQKIPLKTSITDDVGYTFHQGGTFSVKVPEKSEIAALVINQSNTRAYIQIEGESAIVKGVRFDVAIAGPKIIVSPLRTTLKPSNGQIKITVLHHEPPAGKIDQTYFIHHDRLQILGLIFQDATGHSVHKNDHPINRITLSEEAMDEAAELIRNSLQVAGTSEGPPK